MAPNNSPATLTRRIIQFILAQKNVHYHDLMEYTGMSRKTIAKYLNQVESVVKEQGAELVRTRGKGICFKGDTASLLAEYPEIIKSSQSEEERRLDIMTFLTQNQQPILLDDLAERYYISRSTLERDLNLLKQQYSIKLTTTVAGIHFQSSESDMRKISARVLQTYWSQEIQQSKKTGQITRTFQIPDSLKQYVGKEILNQTEDVLDRFVKDLDVKVNEYQYESLLIHTSIAMQRIKKKDYLSHSSSEEDGKKVISSNTRKLVCQLEKKFQCQIPLEEQTYLNIHVAAIEDGYLEIDQDEGSEQELAAWLRQVLSEYDQKLLQNLLLHLKPALRRIKNQISIPNPYCSQIKTYFPLAFARALDLALAIQKQYQVKLNEDEIAYLALHFESYIERRKVFKPDVRVVIVCSTGYGTAELLRQRVRDKLPDVKVVGTLSVNELMKKTPDADIIISTIPLKMNHVHVIQVGPFLDEQDITILNKLSQDVRKKKYAKQAFINLLKPAGIIADSEAKDKKAAIIQLTKKLSATGFVDQAMQASALAREEIASTVIDKFAIPHGDITHVLQPTIGILTSQAGIKWENKKIHVVFFIALNQSVEQQLDDIYSYFYSVIKDKQRMKELTQAKTSQEIIDILKG